MNWPFTRQTARNSVVHAAQLGVISLRLARLRQRKSSSLGNRINVGDVRVVVTPTALLVFLVALRTIADHSNALLVFFVAL